MVMHNWCFVLSLLVQLTCVLLAVAPQLLFCGAPGTRGPCEWQAASCPYHKLGATGHPSTGPQTSLQPKGLSATNLMINAKHRNQALASQQGWYIQDANPFELIVCRKRQNQPADNIVPVRPTHKRDHFSAERQLRPIDDRRERERVLGETTDGTTASEFEASSSSSSSSSSCSDSESNSSTDREDETNRFKRNKQVLQPVRKRNRFKCRSCDFSTSHPPALAAHVKIHASYKRTVAAILVQLAEPCGADTSGQTVEQAIELSEDEDSHQPQSKLDVKRRKIESGSARRFKHKQAAIKPTCKPKPTSVNDKGVASRCDQGSLKPKNSTYKDRTDTRRTDKHSTDKHSRGTHSTDKRSTDKDSTNKCSRDTHSTDKDSTDKRSRDTHSTDKHITDKHSTNKRSRDNHSKRNTASGKCFGKWAGLSKRANTSISTAVAHKPAVGVSTAGGVVDASTAEAIAAPEAAAQTCSNWKKEFSKRQQRAYWFNTENGQSVWTDPNDQKLASRRSHQSRLPAYGFKVVKQSVSSPPPDLD